MGETNGSWLESGVGFTQLRLEAMVVIKPLEKGGWLGHHSPRVLLSEGG